jgi:hypothetical protein
VDITFISQYYRQIYIYTYTIQQAAAAAGEIPRPHTPSLLFPQQPPHLACVVRQLFINCVASTYMCVYMV